METESESSLLDLSELPYLKELLIRKKLESVGKDDRASGLERWIFSSRMILSLQFEDEFLTSVQGRVSCFSSRTSFSLRFKEESLVSVQGWVSHFGSKKSLLFQFKDEFLTSVQGRVSCFSSRTSFLLRFKEESLVSVLGWVSHFGSRKTLLFQFEDEFLTQVQVWECWSTFSHWSGLLFIYVNFLGKPRPVAVSRLTRLWDQCWSTYRHSNSNSSEKLVLELR